MKKHAKKLALWALLGLSLLGLSACGGTGGMMDSLQKEIVTEDIWWELGDTPAGDIGNVVFLSASDGTSRAQVFTGAGGSLEEAWEAAEASAKAGLKNTEPRWVKADVVYIAETIPASELSKALSSTAQGYFRYGVAMDPDYHTALLEGELNGAALFDYQGGGVDLEALNAYLEAAGRPTLEALPETYTVFQTFGWLWDEAGEIHQLGSSSANYGRRQVETLDADYAASLVDSATAYLAEQVQEDGSFRYGLYPQIGQEIEGYNLVRHASTITSLVTRYRMEPSQDLADTIQRTIDYLLERLVYDGEERAYLLEEDSGEIKLGASGLAVVALTEYMEALDNQDYLEVCQHLANGILAMQDPESGAFFHVLSGDFSPKEETRTVYYDGEAAYALCKLYGLTQEDKWLTAAQAAVDHFIAANYVQYADHWVACALNEITKYIDDRPEYYVFALRNAQENLEAIRSQGTTYHTYLELLLATFELYDRMIQAGASVEGFDAEALVDTIYARADRMLNGYFFPEVAMYMQEPQQVEGTFMIRHENFRVRIDDIHHNISAYYHYWQNYDRLVELGMVE